MRDLPDGVFRSSLEALSPTAQVRALDRLREFHFTDLDIPSLRADLNGGVYYVCDLLPAGAGPEAESVDPPPTGDAAVPVSPFPAGLAFHSRPGAPNVLYLNFTGETVVGTAWNTSLGRTSIPALAFSSDSDYSTFNDSEQLVIKRVWQRVAEDFASFDIDVTTVRPGSFNNRTAQALITRNTDANGDPNPSSSAGGVAYVNVFGGGSYASYRPAWVYCNNLSNNESYIAEAASHEIGHNLGLSHDGKTDGSTYYGGHGSGETSWGPLMGTGYNRNVSQWSKGEYYLANNTQDDLATIAGKITYRGDDHGGTPATATPLEFTDGTNVVSTTPEPDPENTNPANKGILERNTDLDVFSFVTGSGPIQFIVNPWKGPVGTRGGNLDLLIELYDETGNLILSSNPATQTAASVTTSLAEGRYYLHVRSTGYGDPFSSSPNGYTSYGCLGQYFISGYVTESSGIILPPIAELQVSDLNQPGQTAKPFTVTYYDQVGVDISTIDGNDVRITGPNGYDRLAQLLSIDRVNNGSPCVATYGAESPAGGEWTPADNGVYTIWLQTNEVLNTQGASAAASELGQFSVAVPLLIYSADLTTNPGWSFEGQWEYGPPVYGGGGPPTGFTGPNIIGYNLSGNYINRLDMEYVVTSPINCAGTSSLTLRFRRWLCLKSGDTASVEVSADGVNWIPVWSASGAVSDSSWQEVQYALPSAVAGSTSVQIRWGMGSNPSKNDIGWNLDDIEILGDGSLDTAPPVAAISVSDLSGGGAPTHSCTVTYTDNIAVRLSSLNSGDLLVTGPNGYSNLVDFVGADLSTDGSPLTANYSILAPGGAWDAGDNGNYLVILLDNEVEDTFNNSAPQALLGNFDVVIPANLPGQLQVSPVGELGSSGFVGGPFSPPSAICVLTNSGASAFDWTISQPEAWLDLSPSSGALNPGEAAAITIALNQHADSLGAGNHSSTISFANVTTGIGDTERTLVLTVNSLLNFQLVATVNEQTWGSVSPTNGLYPAGDSVELTAVSSPYYAFQQWSGDMVTTTNPLTVVMNSNVVLMAEFSELMTTNHSTPFWWLANLGFTNDFEAAVTNRGANGMQLWESYIAGLDPGDPASQLRLILQSAVPAILSWQTVSNRTYSVHYSTNGGSQFLPLEEATNLPPTVSSITNSATVSMPFVLYRLEVRKP